MAVAAMLVLAPWTVTVLVVQAPARRALPPKLVDVPFSVGRDEEGP